MKYKLISQNTFKKFVNDEEGGSCSAIWRSFVMPSSSKAILAIKTESKFFLAMEQKALLAVFQLNKVTANYPRSLALAKDRVHRMQTVQRGIHNAFRVALWLPKLWFYGSMR